MPLTTYLTSVDGAATLDLGTGDSGAWDVTLAQSSVAITIANPPAQDEADVYVTLRQDEGGGQVATWTDTITWDSTPPQPSSEAPVLVHLITTDGTNWYQD